MTSRPQLLRFTRYSVRRILLAIFLSAAAAGADHRTWFKDFPSFTPSKAELNWAAPTNTAAEAAWVYKVVPATFSEATISNLVALGSFVQQHGIKTGTRTVFSDASDTRHLLITPANGAIHFWDEKAVVVKGPVSGVPTTEQSKKLTLDLFGKLGLPVSELAKKSDGTNYLAFEDERSLTRFDPAQNKTVTLTSARGTYLVRQIDGIPFAGIGVGGGFHAMFGNNSAIAEIEVVWRKLKRYKHYKIPDSSQISHYIRNGNAVMTHGTAVLPDGTPLHPDSITRLTITNVEPLYTSARGNEAQDFVYPFLKMATVARYADTNAFVILYCPIVLDSVPPPPK